MGWDLCLEPLGSGHKKVTDDKVVSRTGKVYDRDEYEDLMKVPKR